MPADFVMAVIRCPIKWILKHYPGLGPLHLKSHWQLSDDNLESESQLDCICERPSMNDESFLQVYKSKGSGILQWRRFRAQTCWTTWPQPILCLSVFQWHARKISSQPEKDTTEVQYIMSGVASVGSDILYYCSGVTDSSHIDVNSLVEGEKHAMLATSCEFRPCGFTWALNDAPETASQSAHEFSVSIAAPQYGPTGEQDDEV
ncbi:unnamed protein product [Mesocestoides corti]|uniref:Uncharacterized protein n=1 Tax=Mesocestoides corti TaxID=53468 RepID=A0A0R3URE7_MESCO|nr:unnamed protein product [Mesocestoides corti]